MAVIWVKLEVDGDADEVMDVVDSVLDNGDFQDAINEYARNNDKDVEVDSALAVFTPPPPEPETCTHPYTTVRSDGTEYCLYCDKEFGRSVE